MVEAAALHRSRRGGCTRLMRRSGCTEKDDPEPASHARAGSLRHIERSGGVRLRRHAGANRRHAVGRTDARRPRGVCLRPGCPTISMRGDFGPSPRRPHETTRSVFPCGTSIGEHGFDSRDTTDTVSRRTSGNGSLSCAAGAGTKGAGDRTEAAFGHGALPARPRQAARARTACRSDARTARRARDLQP